MADNSAMPSPDEDFDAVHTGAPIMADNFDDNQPAASPATPTTVPVINQDDEAPAELAAEVAAPRDVIMPTEPAATPVDVATPMAESPSAMPTEPEATIEPVEPVAAAEPASDQFEMPTAVEPTAPVEAEESSATPEAEVEPAASSESSEPAAAETEPLPAVVAAPPQASQPAAPSGAGVVRKGAELVLALAVLGLGFTTWQFHNDKQKLSGQLAAANANPQTIVQKQTESLIQKVGALIQLPSGETPTVANVTDASQAKQQSAFFANAQNGDKVLMYVKAGQAILYRPSTDKIVLVAPLTFTNNTSTTPSGTSTTKK